MNRKLPPTEPRLLPPAVHALGVFLLAICVLASFMLVLEHVTDIALPGCGPSSDCAQAAESVWGTIPVVGWPTSHVGLMYFAGLLGAWIFARGGLGTPLRWILRLGVLGSITFTVIMFIGSYVCTYCFVVHLANAAFFVLVEAGGLPPGQRSIRPIGSFAVLCVLTTAVLGVIELRQRAVVTQQGEEELAQATDQIIRSGSRRPTQHTAQTTDDDDDEPAEPFIGRHRLGPELAPIRIVALTSYQCPDCRRIDTQLMQIVEERDDVSFSMKHFPMSNLCNPNMRGANPQPNSCWAARAAEAAAILRGEDGFWEMHRWLFERRGAFTDRVLKDELPRLGYDPREFVAVMTGAETLRRVHDDIEEGVALGLHYTPMVFINGIELKGWYAPDAVRRAVEEIAATNPPARSPRYDRPPPAIEKYIADWREQRKRSIPADSSDWSLGPEASPLEIVVWGDYQEPFTKEFDAQLRGAIAAIPDARYSFRHYPIDQACNPRAATTKHELACRAARAAEAAGLLGGVQAYWTMHRWLFAHQDEFNDETLRAALIEMGFEQDEFFLVMDDPTVTAAIQEDADAAKTLGLRSIPFIFINGKHLPRWRLEGRPVIRRLVDEALKTSPGE